MSDFKKLACIEVGIERFNLNAKGMKSVLNAQRGGTMRLSRVGKSFILNSRNKHHSHQTKSLDIAFQTIREIVSQEE